MPEPKRKPLQPFARTGRWTGTGRWISGGLGLGAALATILASAHSCGLIGDDSTRLSVANLAVSWIGLSPASDTATAIGDTLRFIASVTDRRGTALVGAAIAWKSDDSSIASVDSAGFVVARAPGATGLTASVAGKVARARVLVRPHAARFDFGPDTLLTVPEGGRRALHIRALDARGHPIARSAPVLHVSDTALVVSEGSDLAGRMAGRTAVVAELDGARDSIGVEVVPVPGRLAVVKGNDQHGGIVSRLPEPVVVRVESRRGRPMAGVLVRFVAGEGGGSAHPDSALSGPDGLAATTWTTGERPGLERLGAAVAGVDSQAIALAEVEPSRANTRVAQLGDAPSGLAAGPEPVIVGVQLTDSSGRTLAGVPVSWKSLDGGRMTPRDARSDSAGEARAQWWLGPRAGVQRARVVVGAGRNVPPITVLAASFPGAPAKLTSASDATVDGVAGTAVAKPIPLRVTDSVGNGVPGIAIAVSGAGSAESLLVSDSLGRALIHWTLGDKAGVQSLQALVDNVLPLRLTARVRPAAPANVAFVDGASATSTTQAKGRPARVRVTDVYGNPVPEAQVTFTASSGKVRPARVATGQDGTALTMWLPGRASERQVLTAVLQRNGAKDVLELAPRRVKVVGTKTSGPPPKPRT